MGKQSSPARRLRALQWYAGGRSVTSTCRHFGISRTTFYRWQRRYDPLHPTATLRRRRRPPRPSPRGIFFPHVLEIAMSRPGWGSARVRAALLAHLAAHDLRDRPDAPAERTIRRWLKEIRTRCPVCHGRGGLHGSGLHALRRDFLQLGVVAPVRLQLPRAR